MRETQQHLFRSHNFHKIYMFAEHIVSVVVIVAVFIACRIVELKLVLLSRCVVFTTLISSRHFRATSFISSTGLPAINSFVASVLTASERENRKNAIWHRHGSVSLVCFESFRCWTLAILMEPIVCWHIRLWQTQLAHIHTHTHPHNIVQWWNFQSI